MNASAPNVRTGGAANLVDAHARPAPNDMLLAPAAAVAAATSRPSSTAAGDAAGDDDEGFLSGIDARIVAHRKQLRRTDHLTGRALKRGADDRAEAARKREDDDDEEWGSEKGKKRTRARNLPEEERRERRCAHHPYMQLYYCRLPSCRARCGSDSTVQRCSSPCLCRCVASAFQSVKRTAPARVQARVEPRQRAQDTPAGGRGIQGTAGVHRGAAGREPRGARVPAREHRGRRGPAHAHAAFAARDHGGGAARRATGAPFCLVSAFSVL
jgi:hypothetical protein